MTNARERISHKPTEYSKRNQITSLSFICLSLHTYKMRLTRKNLEYSCQLYNPVIFKMYSIKCSSALCPDSCSSNNFPGEFGLGSLQVCVISEVILQAEATSHTLAPERPHHSSLDAKDPKAKCPPRKRTHNPVNHTGRTGWFCSTFLIAHILLFLSDWKKNLIFHLEDIEMWGSVSTANHTQRWEGAELGWWDHRFCLSLCFTPNSSFLKLCTWLQALSRVAKEPSFKIG